MTYADFAFMLGLSGLISGTLVAIAILYAFKEL